MSGNIDFENIKWGSFTKQFQAYRHQYPKSKVKDLDAFAKMVLRNPKKFQPRTQKRASFYLNVILPQHSARGGAETDSDTGSESDSESDDEKVGGLYRHLYNTALQGGKISISSLKGLLNKSYDKTPDNYLDYEVDKELSGQRVQVYKNKKTGEVVVSHRGTQGIHDIGTDLKYALGFDLHNTERFKHAQDIQRKAEAKYGAKNITTIGHSLGSKLARDVGQNSKEVIELNPAYNIPDALKKKSDNTYSIRTKYDPVSFLVPLFKKDKNTTTLESKTINPLAEHTVSVLDRADQDKEIGQGRSGGMFSWVRKVFDKNPQLTPQQRQQAEMFADELMGDPNGVSFEGASLIPKKVRKQLAEEWAKEQQEKVKMGQEDINMIGKGLKKKSLRELKALAKKLPKQHRIKLTKVKKNDLVSHLCSCGGFLEM
jgi:hypothetical protein